MGMSHPGGEHTIVVVHTSSCSVSFQERMPSILRNLISPSEWVLTVRPLNRVLRRGQRFKIVGLILLFIFIVWLLVNVACAEEPMVTFSPDGAFLRCYGSPLLPLPFVIFTVALLIIASIFRRRLIREIIRNLNETTWKGCLGYKHNRQIMLIYLEELKVALTVARRHSPLNAPVKDARMSSMSPPPQIPDARNLLNPGNGTLSTNSEYYKGRRFYQPVRRSNCSLGPKTRIDSGGSFYTAFPKSDDEPHQDIRNRLPSECAPIGFDYDEAESAQSPTHPELSPTEIEQKGSRFSNTAQVEDGSWHAQIS